MPRRVQQFNVPQWREYGQSCGECQVRRDASDYKTTSWSYRGLCAFTQSFMSRCSRNTSQMRSRVGLSPLHHRFRSERKSSTKSKRSSIRSGTLGLNDYNFIFVGKGTICRKTHGRMMETSSRQSKYESFTQLTPTQTGGRSR